MKDEIIKKATLIQEKLERGEAIDKKDHILLLTLTLIKDEHEKK